MPEALETVQESRRPTMGEWFNEAAALALGKLRVCLPGRVETYDAVKQTISVKPLLQAVQRKENGSTEAVSVPILNGVPVVFPGAGGYRATFPVTKGDTVLLVFADRSLDIWKSKGGEVDPIDLRQHHLSDAVAIVGLHDLVTPWANAPTDQMTLGFDTGPLIRLKQAAIELGNAASQGVGLGDAIKTFADAVVSAFNSHTHTVPISGPAGTTPTTPPLTPLSAAPTMASGIAKVTP